MTEIFADGVGAIAVGNGVARIELVQLRRAKAGEAKLLPEPTATLQIPLAGLLQMTQQLTEAARKLQDQQGERVKARKIEKDAEAADEALTNL